MNANNRFRRFRANHQKNSDYDAVIVGSGPNGLAAAITLAEAGQRVLVIEGASTIGGGMRTMALTEPGFQHDICSAVHPLGIGSPFFRRLNLARYGLRWIHAPVPLAHPLDDQPAILLHHSAQRTAEGLDRDGQRWRWFIERPARNWQQLAPALLGPRPDVRQFGALAQIGPLALLPASVLARSLFRDERTQALFGGLAAHAIQPLHHPLTASFGLVLGMLAHAVGWPMPLGGSQAIADALAAYLRELGGEIVTGQWVNHIDELPTASTRLLDVTPRQFLSLAEDALPPSYRRKLIGYRYGPGICKIDYALSEPVPWQDPRCTQAGTVHLGGTLHEIAQAEAAVGRGLHAERPYVLLSQPSLFDPTRAPSGQHTLWAYCHVPHGSTRDVSAQITAQIERFAPGFRDIVIATRVHSAVQMAAHNPNYVGGDINGGVQDWRQFWTRPLPQWNPYATPLPGVYLCSSATPPGGGVHGMAGVHAARSVLASQTSNSSFS